MESRQSLRRRCSLIQHFHTHTHTYIYIYTCISILCQPMASSIRKPALAFMQICMTEGREKTHTHKQTRTEKKAIPSFWSARAPGYYHYIRAIQFHTLMRIIYSSFHPTYLFCFGCKGKPAHVHSFVYSFVQRPNQGPCCLLPSARVQRCTSFKAKKER